MRPAAGIVAAARRGLRAEFGDERTRVERLEAEPAGDLLARRARAREEERTETVARLGVPPPVLAELAAQVRAELRRPDPRAQVVRRVEARIHVRQISVLAIAEADGA